MDENSIFLIQLAVWWRHNIRSPKWCMKSYLHFMLFQNRKYKMGVIVHSEELWLILNWQLFTILSISCIFARARILRFSARVLLYKLCISFHKGCARKIVKYSKWPETYSKLERKLFGAFKKITRTSKNWLLTLSWCVPNLVIWFNSNHALRIIDFQKWRHRWRQKVTRSLKMFVGHLHIMTYHW